MRLTKNKTVIIIATVIFIAAVIATYFIITKRAEIKEIVLSSYDGRATFTLSTENDNITKAEVKEENYVKFIPTAKIYYKDENVFVEYIKSNPCYIRTFEFIDDKGNIKTKRMLLLSQKYYYTVDIVSEENYAEIASLCAHDSPVEMYPFFNDDMYIPNETIDDHVYGGEEEMTIDEFNSCYKGKMRENAYNSYEDLKEYYSHIDSELYKLNDEEKTISLKLYSALKIKQKYYDDYPILIKFTDNGTVIMSIHIVD